MSGRVFEGIEVTHEQRIALDADPGYRSVVEHYAGAEFVSLLQGLHPERLQTLTADGVETLKVVAREKVLAEAVCHVLPPVELTDAQLRARIRELAGDLRGTKRALRHWIGVARANGCENEARGADASGRADGLSSEEDQVREALREARQVARQRGLVPLRAEVLCPQCRRPLAGDGEWCPCGYDRAAERTAAGRDDELGRHHGTNV